MKSGYSNKGQPAGQPPPLRSGETVTVKFVRKAKPYWPGDRAGFPPDQARRLVERGMAVYIGDASAEPGEESD